MPERDFRVARRKRAITLIGSLTLLTWVHQPRAAETAPYFASIKSDKIFMRVGPGEQYDIKWIYHRKGLPVEVLGSYDAWRRVRDADGEVGWIHTALLSRERMAIVTGQGFTPVLSDAAANSRTLAEAKPGSVGRLRHCDAFACDVKFDGAEGWVPRSRLWGLRDGERF
jgi:SH3-like domain-containing protein